jgi:hypothetical protein
MLPVKVEHSQLANDDLNAPEMLRELAWLSYVFTLHVGQGLEWKWGLIWGWAAET